VPDLVTEMAQQGAVGLVHCDAELFEVDVIAFDQIQGDQAVVVAGQDSLVLAGEQVECQAAFGILVATHDGQLEIGEFED
jgi:hypothetical protein